jgi:hypothetical protein
MGVAISHEKYEEKLFEKEIEFFPLERYINSYTHIEHICLNDHVWKARPDSILNGHGCPHCFGNAKLTDEMFRARLPDTLKALEPYKGTSHKIKHECLICSHVWKVEPHSTMRGHGCPKCAKYGLSPNEPCYLYLVSFENDEILYYKLGISKNSDLSYRYKGDWNRFAMKKLWDVYLPTGDIAKALEQSLLSMNSNFLLNTGLLKSGNTESLSVYIDKPTI